MQIKSYVAPRRVHFFFILSTVWSSHIYIARNRFRLFLAQCVSKSCCFCCCRFFFFFFFAFSLLSLYSIWPRTTYRLHPSNTFYFEAKPNIYSHNSLKQTKNKRNKFNLYFNEWHFAVAVFIFSIYYYFRNIFGWCLKHHVCDFRSLSQSAFEVNWPLKKLLHFKFECSLPETIVKEEKKSMLLPFL